MRNYLLTTMLFSAATLLAAPKCPPPCDTPKKVPAKPVCCLFEEGCTNWYAGAGLSFADLFYFNNTQSNNTSGSFAGNDSDKESSASAPSLGYNAFFGYSYNDYLDVEFKFAQIVRPFKNNYRSDFSFTQNDDVLNGTSRLYFISFGPYVLLNLPMYQLFTPFFRFGMVTDLITFKESAKEDESSNTDNSITTASQKEYLWAEKLNLGIGFKSNWKNYVTVKVEYETPTSTIVPGRTTTGTGDDFYIPGILSLSALFEF